MNFEKKLTQVLYHDIACKKNDKIVVGISGGADSVALLYSLQSIQDFDIVAVHVNYHLRGNDSKEDENFVRNLCLRLAIKLHVLNSHINSQEKSMEVKARNIRLSYFKRILQDENAKYIALAHHKNDQVETVLHRLFRGTGIHGLQGIKLQQDQIIHPLLHFSKKEILHYLEEKNITWREDKTNYETKFTRNKIRNIFLPWIKENINHKADYHLFNLSVLMTETETYLRKMANISFLEVMMINEIDHIRFSLSKFKAQDPIIRYYILKKAIIHLSGKELGFYQVHFDAIDRILNAKESKIVSLSYNVKVSTSYNVLDIFLESKNKGNEIIIEAFDKEYLFQQYQIVIRKNSTGQHDKKKEIIFDLDKVSFPIKIRNRKNGDRFIPSGLSHRKKLKDFFIDEKIPKFDRDTFLIVEDQNKILSIIGLRNDGRSLPSKNTSSFLIIKVEKNKQ